MSNTFGEIHLTCRFQCDDVVKWLLVLLTSPLVMSTLDGNTESHAVFTLTRRLDKKQNAVTFSRNYGRQPDVWVKRDPPDPVHEVIIIGLYKIYIVAEKYIKIINHWSRWCVQKYWTCLAFIFKRIWEFMTDAYLVKIDFNIGYLLSFFFFYFKFPLNRPI